MYILRNRLPRRRLDFCPAYRCARKSVSVVFVQFSAAARLADELHGPTQSIYCNRSHLQKYLLTELQGPVLVIARVYGHSFGSSVEAKV